MTGGHSTHHNRVILILVRIKNAVQYLFFAKVLDVIDLYLFRFYICNKDYLSTNKLRNCFFCELKFFWYVNLDNT